MSTYLQHKIASKLSKTINKECEGLPVVFDILGNKYKHNIKASIECFLFNRNVNLNLKSYNNKTVSGPTNDMLKVIIFVTNINHKIGTFF